MDHLELHIAYTLPYVQASAVLAIGFMFGKASQKKNWINLTEK